MIPKAIRTQCEGCISGNCENCIVGMCYDSADDFLRKTYEKECKHLSESFHDKCERYQFRHNRRK